MSALISWFCIFSCLNWRKFRQLKVRLPLKLGSYLPTVWEKLFEVCISKEVRRSLRKTSWVIKLTKGQSSLQKDLYILVTGESTTTFSQVNVQRMLREGAYLLFSTGRIKSLSCIFASSRNSRVSCVSVFLKHFYTMMCHHFH